MSLTSSLRVAFDRIVNPTQLQIYGIVDGRMRLRIVASITGTPTIDDDGWVHCATTAVFSAVHDGWLTESPGNLTLPGTIDRMAVEQTDFGWLILWLSLPEDNAVVAFFPWHGTRTSKRCGGNLTISQMDLGSIAKQARLPQIVLDAERPPDDNG